MKRYPSALAAKCPLLWKPYFFSLILIFYYTRKKHFSKGKSPLPNECLPPFTAHIHVYKFFYSITCILVPDNCKTGNPLINYYLHNTTISPTHMFRFSIIPTSFYRSLCSSPSPAFQSAQTGKTSHKYMSLHGCHQVPWGVRQLHQSYEYSEKQALLNPHNCLAVLSAIHPQFPVVLAIASSPDFIGKRQARVCLHFYVLISKNRFP